MLVKKKTREIYMYNDVLKLDVLVEKENAGIICNGDLYFDMLVKKENAGNISNDDLQLDVLAEAVDSILLVGVGLHPLLQAA